MTKALTDPRPTMTPAPDLVTFDCDGVLVDSERISLRIQVEHLTALGLSMTLEDCVRDFLGLGMPATVEIVERRLGRPLHPSWESGLAEAVTAAFRQDLDAVPGIRDALDAIAIPTCVASSGTHAKMRLTLGLTGLYDRFAGRIFLCRRGRPGQTRPGPLPPRRKDSEHSRRGMRGRRRQSAGIDTAIAAGMRCIAYAGTTPAERLAAADAGHHRHARPPAHSERRPLATTSIAIATRRLSVAVALLVRCACR